MSTPAVSDSPALDPHSSCAPGTPLYGEILELLYREAEHLDEHRFQEWLALFSEDVRYLMPVRTTELRARGAGFMDVAFFDDNFHSLSTRVQRLGTEAAWAETPPSRTRHFVSNVLVRPGERAHEYAVTCCFMVTRCRGEQAQQLFTGRREDVLRRMAPGQLRIALRKILVDQTVITGTNLSILF